MVFVPYAEHPILTTLPVAIPPVAMNPVEMNPAEILPVAMNPVEMNPMVLLMTVQTKKRRALGGFGCL